MTLAQLPVVIARPIVVIGGALGEISVHVPDIPSRGSHVWASPAGDDAYTLGGSAFNVVRHVASQLSADQVHDMVTPAITVGLGPWGQRIDAELRSYAMASPLPASTADNGWCLTLITPDKERTFVTMTGCEIHWDQTVLERLEIPRGAVVYVSGFQLLAPGQALMRWSSQLPADVTLVVDPGAVAQRLVDHGEWEELGQRIDVLTCNEPEEDLIVSSLHAGDCTGLVDRYGFTVVRRRGGEGASVLSPTSNFGADACSNVFSVHVSAPAVDVVDTTGAGDAHSAALLVGLAAMTGRQHAVCGGECGATWEQILQKANGYAADVVTRIGPM
ncbi:PfkB family carbohydrate kinase [Actinomyces vulturis]|uniref:PfkB family carbohydrate kinase n=1 Tax=Actinomyces vulturis TaxID=1857645 RepID=UPI0008312ACA|nr:PfkB family carbohydrate kinase [Actinomyces vulturis]